MASLKKKEIKYGKRRSDETTRAKRRAGSGASRKTASLAAVPAAGVCVGGYFGSLRGVRALREGTGIWPASLAKARPPMIHGGFVAATATDQRRPGVKRARQPRDEKCCAGCDGRANATAASSFLLFFFSRLQPALFPRTFEKCGRAQNKKRRTIPARVLSCMH